MGAVFYICPLVQIYNHITQINFIFLLNFVSHLLEFHWKLSRFLAPKNVSFFVLSWTYYNLPFSPTIVTKLFQGNTYFYVAQFSSQSSVFILLDLSQHLTELVSCMFSLYSFKDSSFGYWAITIVWFSFYLFGGPISVPYPTSSSSPLLPDVGVSLRSVLRPLLFGIYTHPSVISSNLMYFFLTLKCASVDWTSLLNPRLNVQTLPFHLH